MIERAGALSSERADVLCPACEKPVLAEVAGGVMAVEEPSGNTLRVRLIECPDCGQAIVISQTEDADGWSTANQVFPYVRDPLSSSVPVSLRREYEEAVTCYKAKAYTATAVMVRRTLEGVCSDQGVAGDRRQTLVRSLELLKERNLIDPRLFEWAQALRVLGNEGAHFTGRPVAKDDARDALDLAQALLEYLYVLSVKFSEFISRRQVREH
ncbi:DUF4145 domain-containing protein [Streptomyces europaeiscabiei]|uniref:DUF4145 domain-containing protein n=1 Tax=Streptomyces europaeiscabiei TaxID=146819 RepID=UPI00099D8A71|nr:DUF4145 domain-containing protein [Streptomyces europaeiscabiei]